MILSYGAVEGWGDGGANLVCEVDVSFRKGYVRFGGAWRSFVTCHWSLVGRGIIWAARSLGVAGVGNGQQCSCRALYIHCVLREKPEGILGEAGKNFGNLFG